MNRPRTLVLLTIGALALHVLAAHAAVELPDVGGNTGGDIKSLSSSKFRDLFELGGLWIGGLGLLGILGAAALFIIKKFREATWALVGSGLGLFVGAIAYLIAKFFIT